MPLSREPRIHPVPITALRPTQITVGMREVNAKRRSWRDHPDRKKADFLGKHLIPVIWGPKEEYYVIDHHHLTLALHHEGVKNIATTVVADLRRLPREAFWVIKHGIKMSAMPAWGGSHDDATIWSMVAFLQKLPDLSPAQYKDIVARAPPDEDMDMVDDRHGENGVNTRSMTIPIAPSSGASPATGTSSGTSP